MFSDITTRLCIDTKNATINPTKHEQTDERVTLPEDRDDGVLQGEEKPHRLSLKKQLKQLIAQPVFTRQMKTKYPTQMGRLQLPLTTADTALASLSRDTLPR
ncbi:hypothetical protein cypCar_00040052 [Cyprinus carpio]|nr:hypothetical protein cypCar_00040052 [Cyprinus carpio]